MKALQTRPPEWVATAPVRVVASKEVAASPDEVFAVLADHEAWPTWFTAVKSVEVLGPAEGVGARRRVHIPGGVAVDEEFVSWEPGKRFGFTVTHMSRPLAASMNEDVQLEDLSTEAGGRTRVTYTMAMEPKGVAKVLVPLLKKQFQKGISGGLDGLAARFAP